MNQIFRWFNDFFMPSPEGDNVVLSFESMKDSYDLELEQLKALYGEGFSRFSKTQKEEMKVGLDEMKDVMKLHIADKTENMANYSTMLQNMKNNTKTISDFCTREKELCRKAENNKDDISKDELQKYKEGFQKKFAMQLATQLKDFSEKQMEYIQKRKDTYTKLNEGVDKIGNFDDRSIMKLQNVLKGLNIDQS